MEYFVRTSHIVSGFIYSISLIIVLDLIFFGNEWRYLEYRSGGANIQNILELVFLVTFVPVLVISSIHYIVLKKFHPWIKMSKVNKNKKEIEDNKLKDEWNMKVVISIGAVFGVLCSGLIFHNQTQGMYTGFFENYGQFLIGYSVIGAIGGVLLFGIVAVIRNKFIVRK